jgi:hypothetical protein
MARLRPAAWIAALCAPLLAASLASDLLTDPAPTTNLPAASRAPDVRLVLPEPQLLPLAGNEAHEVHSLLAINKPMKFGDYAWHDRDVPPGPLVIRVDLSRQTMSVFRGAHEIGAAVILYGADHKPTPPGRFTILEKRAQHRSNLYDAEMPYMLRLTNDGIAIHASELRPGIATNGCIGVPLGFARALFGVARRGDEVVIVG